MVVCVRPVYGHALKNAGVLLAALALVASVWLALQLSRTMPASSDEPARTTVPPIGDVPGFRADAWYLPGDELLGFVEVPGGPFAMGSDPARDTTAFDIERWSAESAQGSVDVPTFLIGRYEVTVAQYAAFVAHSGHGVADEQALSAPPDHPVGSVAWTDAVAYTRWLQARLEEWSDTPPELRRLFDEGWRVGLPSEAEWEKAARGTDGRIYPWGDEPRADRANYLSRAASQVGTYGCPECPFELYDMAGNVWEWTRSPDQPYPYDPGDDREALEAEALWIMRGGSYADPAHFVRAANRGRADPGVRRPFIGFRVVLSRD